MTSARMIERICFTMPPMFIANGDVALFALNEKTFNAKAPSPLIMRSRGKMTEFVNCNSVIGTLEMNHKTHQY